MTGQLYLSLVIGPSYVDYMAINQSERFFYYYPNDNASHLKSSLSPEKKIIQAENGGRPGSEVDAGLPQIDPGQPGFQF